MTVLFFQQQMLIFFSTANILQMSHYIFLQSDLIIDVKLRSLKFVVVIFSMFEQLMCAYRLCILHYTTYLLLSFSLKSVCSLDIFQVCVIGAYCVMLYVFKYVTL